MKKFLFQKNIEKIFEKENFLSSMVTLNVDGKPQNVLPREIKYHMSFLMNQFMLIF